jgi:hypothetical protein
LELDVSLPLKEWFDVEAFVSLADFTSLAFSVWFDDAASVAANDLLELVVKLSVLVSLFIFE